MYGIGQKPMPYTIPAPAHVPLAGTSVCLSVQMTVSYVVYQRLFFLQDERNLRPAARESRALAPHALAVVVETTGSGLHRPWQ